MSNGAIIKKRTIFLPGDTSENRARVQSFEFVYVMRVGAQKAEQRGEALIDLSEAIRASSELKDRSDGVSEREIRDPAGLDLLLKSHTAPVRRHQGRHTETTSALDSLQSVRIKRGFDSRQKGVLKEATESLLLNVQRCKDDVFRRPTRK